MREMALNHAAVWAPESNREEISRWLRDVAIGISQLVDNKVVEKVLRTSQQLHETLCLRDLSLFHAIMELGRSGYPVEQGFLMGLLSKTPLLHEIEEDVKDRFYACEGQNLSSEDGGPLVLCAITDGVAIGFPSAPHWNRHQVTVSFKELLPDETFEETSEEIDHLACSIHAGPICKRHRARRLDQIRDNNKPDDLWDNRQEIFPNLLFGQDVKNHLRTSSNRLQAIVKVLASLEHSARDWKDRGGPAPPWEKEVKNESYGVRNDPTLSRQRRFRSHDGTPRYFFWHVGFGGPSGRIHLHLDPELREVEIGYIGKHLPLKKK